MESAKFEFCREKDLTIEELRGSQLFSNFSDEEALKVLETIKTFTRIIFDFYSRKMGETPLNTGENDVSSI